MQTSEKLAVGLVIGAALFTTYAIIRIATIIF